MELLDGVVKLGGPSLACSSLPGCSFLAPVLCSPVLWFLQLQSCLTLLGIGIAWLWASQSRVKESRRIRAAQRAGNPLAFVNSDVATLSHEKQRQLPFVSVVLAVKGASEQSIANWRSQLVTLYGGPLEYIFCVESKDDPAYDAVHSLQKEMLGVCNVRLVVAGLANACSQQIHNQLAGANAADESSKYLLFLDDDIQCHPGTIGALVDSLEQRPEVFVCTGYSFDVPSTPSVAAYAAMAYRLPLLIGMSSGGPCFFVWGGCIMLRTADLRTDRHGVATALKKNGYSNDLILTSVAGLNKRAVWCPSVALFPGRMSGDWTFTRYWNYVRRQIFALLTYCSSYAYRTNRTGWVCYSYLALAVVLPLIPSLFHVLYSIGIFGYEASLLASSGYTATGAAAATGALSTAQAALSWSASTAWRHSLCPIGLVMSVANLGCLAFATLMCVRLFFAAITLCNLLSPEKRPIDIGNLSLVLGVAGMLVNLSCLPAIAIYTWIRKDITWAGIRYVRRKGVVASVQHPHQQSSFESSAHGPKFDGQEMVSLEEREDGEAEDRQRLSVGKLEVVSVKDVESQVQGSNTVDWDASGRRLVQSAFVKGGVLSQVEGWVNSLPLVGRAFSPSYKKLG